MNLNLHIERLVLDGLPVTGAQSPRVLAAVETELTRLFRKSAIKQPPAGDQQRRPVQSIQVTPNGSPARLGRQIARAVHASMLPGAATPARVLPGGKA